jgi:peptidoglycan/xylan/chitin deacetylase (PgdA/CDA1 family)
MAGTNTLMVLGWHNVTATHCFPASPGAGERGMEQQFRALRRFATVVPLGAALRDLAQGRPLPPRAVAITFDDGYRDNLTVAGPMLRRLGLPATCFLVPGLLSGTVLPWWERLGWAFAQAAAPAVQWEDRRLQTADPAARRRAFGVVSELLKRRDRRRRDAAVEELVGLLSPSGSYDPAEQFLDWDGARALRDHMELGSHSMYHAILSEETPQDQRDDLATSRRELTEQLDVDIRVLAYPNGTPADYDADTLTAVRQAGYDHAVTTRPGWNTPATPPHEIHRWVMNPERGLVDLGKFVRDLRLRRRI